MRYKKLHIHILPALLGLYQLQRQRLIDRHTVRLANQEERFAFGSGLPAICPRLRFDDGVEAHPALGVSWVRLSQKKAYILEAFIEEWKSRLPFVGNLRRMQLIIVDTRSPIPKWTHLQGIANTRRSLFIIVTGHDQTPRPDHQQSSLRHDSSGTVSSPGLFFRANIIWVCHTRCSGPLTALSSSFHSGLFQVFSPKPT